ncbi:hypothetical protein QMK17_17200 [Rhodococcus sp. G-MC3]|uniref:T3SS (YopN, CesT) and YbjN peptide-binding chaperone 1 n=1 Tax=Rhodococcus sp. G-MC3 TaxID=3046209 RepID=UPI0024BB765A|nr:hypothetical protein [Rhodococcus sp. G-MC3]MDJ0395064.1 hypothetical protein [Rhodococcus sp. G-MC3]
MAEEPDFDTEVQTAWSRFERNLASYLGDMSDDDVLAICTGREKPGRRDDLTLNATKIGGVSKAEAVIQGSLLRAMSDDEWIFLLHAGWTGTSDDPATSIGKDIQIEGEPDEVAQAITVLLREFRGITHPSFLAASATGISPTSVFDAHSVLDGWGTVNARTRLSDEVDAALESITGAAPVKDEDGGIPFTADGRTAYLKVLEREPVVEVFSVFSVHPRARSADKVVHEYDGHWPDVRFQIGEEHVIASVRVDCSPLVEEHLGRGLGMFLRFIEEHGDAMAASLYEAADGFALPPEFLTIVHLQADTTQPLTPEDVALICNNDRDSILQYLDICSTEAHLDDPVWNNTAQLLRSALRFVVLTMPRKGLKTSPPNNGK